MSPNNQSAEKLPQHIAIIMDGNGRWAEQRKLSRSQGHIEGVKRTEQVVDLASKMGIKVLTLFTFSTENWSRPEQEVSTLMTLIITVLQKKMQKLMDNNIRFQVVGRRAGIPATVLETMDNVMMKTSGNRGMVMNLAFNYGSRVEMIDAVKNIADQVRNNQLSSDQITEATINEALYTKGLPDPDLLIRTSGEKRISNFLLWQLSYAELYFTDVLWPDFDEHEFQKAINEYQHRIRRFGSVSENTKVG